MSRRPYHRNPSRVSDTMLIDRDNGVEGDPSEIEVTIEGDYTAGTPDRFYLRNGDPGYPGDPSEVDDITATDAAGNEVKLTDAELQKAREILIEKGGEE